MTSLRRALEKTGSTGSTARAIGKDLGWKPQISLEKGVADMVAWGRKYLPQLVTVPQTYTFHA